MTALKISYLTKSFGHSVVLRDVTFQIESGTLVAILGASGSGKTTLLRLIAGFERADSGVIQIDDEVSASGTIFKRPEQRGIGYVAQEGALFPHLSVADNITFGLNRKLRKSRYRVNELLTLVDLPISYADRGPQALSGGEQQRVALARALAPNPKLVLLDEPFSALDAGLRVETREAVALAIRAAGATAILVTHDQSEALSMGSRVGVLQKGVLTQMSVPEDLYRHPQTAGIANFIGDAVFLPGIARHGEINCALGTLSASNVGLNGPVEVMIRPEQIKLLDEPRVDAAQARVGTVVFHGHDAIVKLRLPNTFPATDVMARVFSQILPKPGATVWLKVEGDVAAYPTISATAPSRAVSALNSDTSHSNANALDKIDPNGEI
jgi:iron(III) transport system ATP-binding protein